MPVSAEHSPWWAQVESDLHLSPGMVGKVVSTEELVQIIPAYPDGRRPRARAAVRRLRRILELVERGPNGSLSRGAKYRIVPLIQTPSVMDSIDPELDTVVELDLDWLEQSIERMTTSKK